MGVENVKDKFSDFTDSKKALKENCSILLLVCVQYFRKNILPVNLGITTKNFVKAKAIIYNIDRSYAVQYVNTRNHYWAPLPAFTPYHKKEERIKYSCIITIHCAMYKQYTV